MYAKLPEPWMIEKMRRENERDDRPALELPLPPPVRRRPEMDESDRRGGTVIVIEL